MSALGIPSHIFPEVAMPALCLGHCGPACNPISDFAGAFPCIAVASHDTASAVAAIPELDDSSLFLSSGTWSLIGVAVGEPNLSEEAFNGGFTNEGSADGGALLMKNLTGLWILQECVRMWDAAGSITNGRSWSAPHLLRSRSAALSIRLRAEFQSPADMGAEIRKLLREYRSVHSGDPGRDRALYLREPELRLSRGDRTSRAHYAAASSPRFAWWAADA